MSWKPASSQRRRDPNPTDLDVLATEAAPAITITRVFQAPRELVWKEWTQPARFADWFGGAEIEVPPASVNMDLRPGGAWTATTVGFGPAGRDIRWSGEYLEVVEPERLVFTISGLRDEPAPSLVTMMLCELGEDLTEMLFQQHGMRTTLEHELARAQWSLEFDRITARLAVDPSGPA